MSYDPEASPEVTASSQKNVRPGCITAYAILLIGGSVMGLASSACLLALYLGAVITTPDISTTMLAPELFYPLPLLVLNLLAALGLWRMRRWGMILVVINIGLGFFLALIRLPSFSDASVMIPFVLGVLLNVYILYWFHRNRYKFNGHATLSGSNLPPVGS